MGIWCTEGILGEVFLHNNRLFFLFCFFYRKWHTQNKLVIILELI